MAEVNRLEWDAYIRDSEFMASINRIERRIDGMVDNVTKKGRDIDDVFKRMAQAAAGFFTINQAQNFVNQLIAVRSEFQQLEIAFTTMLGSKEKADQLTKDLIEFAATTPFGMKDTANAAKQLLAYGSSAKNVKNELRMLGDVAAGTSSPIGELVYLYGTLRTQGRAYLMDIRQFAGRGIPIYQELAKVLNVSKNQVNDLVSAGKVGFAEVERAFKNMTVSGSMFGGLMEAQSKTIQGELERLGDGFDQMLNDIGKSTEGLIGQTIQGLALMVENYENVLTSVTALVAIYGAYRAALVVNAALMQLNAARALGLTAAELLHYGALTATTAAQKALNAVMLASPVIAYTATIAALGAVIYSLTQVTDATTASLETLNKVREEAGKQADKESRSIEQLVSVLKDNAASAEQKKSAYDKLIAQTDGILNSYTLEEIAAGKAQASLDSYIAKIREATSVRKSFAEFNELADKMDELNRKGIEGVGTWEKLGRSLKNTFIPTSQGVGFAEWGRGLFSSAASDATILNQEKKVLEKQMDDLKDTFGEKWKEVITGVREDVDNASTQVSTTVSERLKQINSDIAKTQSELKNAMSGDSVYDKSKIDGFNESLKALQAEKDAILGVSKESKKATKELEKFQNERESLFKKIADRKYEFDLEGKKQDEQELERIGKYYDDLRKEIEEFNKTAPKSKKIGGSTFNLLSNMESGELSFKRQEQVTKKKLEQYEKDYQNYIRYEELKKQAGESYADSQFQDNLAATKEYYNRLSGEVTALMAKQSEVGLSVNEESQLKGLLEQRKEFNNRKKQLEQESFINALKLAQTHADRLIAIEREYQDAMQALGQSASEEQKEQLKKRLKEGQIAANKEFIESQKEFEESMKFIDDAGAFVLPRALELGRTTVKKIIDGIREKRPDLSKQLDELEKDYNEFFDKATIEARFANFDAISSLVNGFDQLVDMALSFDGSMASSLKTIGRMVGQVGQLASTLGKAGGGLSKAGPAGAIIGALFSMAGALEEVQQRNAQKYVQSLQYANEYQFKQLEVVTKSLERQLQLVQDIYGTDRVKSFISISNEAASEFRKNIEALNAGTDISNIDPRGKDGKILYDTFQGKRQSVKYQMTGNAEYDEIIALLNSGANVEKAMGITVPKLNQFYEKIRKMILDGFLKPVELSFTDVTKIGEKELSELYNMVNNMSLDEATRAQVQNILDQYELWKNAMNQMREELTGVSFKGFADGLVSMFEQGKVSAKDFTEYFEKQMQSSILKAFSREHIEGQFQGWYEEFFEASKSDGKLTDNEIADLKSKYDQLTEKAKEEFDKLKQATGIDFSSDKSSQGELSKGISGITESTANRLEAEFGGLRIAQLQLLETTKSNHMQYVHMANDRLSQLIAIQNNTLRTANNTDRLANIETAIVDMNRKISNSDAIRRGAGL